MGGMMMSLTSELTTLPTATPIITPTAKARALALSKNSLKPDTQSLLGLRRAVVRGRAHERGRASVSIAQPSGALHGATLRDWPLNCDLRAAATMTAMRHG